MTRYVCQSKTPTPAMQRHSVHSAAAMWWYSIVRVLEGELWLAEQQWLTKDREGRLPLQKFSIFVTRQINDVAAGRIQRLEAHALGDGLHKFLVVPANSSTARQAKVRAPHSRVGTNVAGQQLCDCLQIRTGDGWPSFGSAAPTWLRRRHWRSWSSSAPPATTRTWRPHLHCPCFLPKPNDRQTSDDQTCA